MHVIGHLQLSSLLTCYKFVAQITSFFLHKYLSHPNSPNPAETQPRVVDKNGRPASPLRRKAILLLPERPHDPRRSTHLPCQRLNSTLGRLPCGPLRAVHHESRPRHRRLHPRQSTNPNSRRQRNSPILPQKQTRQLHSRLLPGGLLSGRADRKNGDCQRDHPHRKKG